jgi:hypothetical protein
VTQGENTIYFNGKDNLDAIFTMLTSGVVGKKLTDATEVMLTGCSAGGLSVFIHSDTVQTYLSSQTKYGAIPMSGFFTDEVNIKDIHVYGTEIQRIFDLSQAEQGVHAGCVADNSENPWKCMMAPYVSDYIETPTFILNSIYDSWQTSCELFSAIPSIDSAGNGNCTAYPSYSTCQADLENCTGSQIAQVNTYGSNCLATLKASNLYSKNGNGGFLYSCHTHCAAQQSSPYTTFVNQATGTSMQQAVTKWWSSALASAPLWYEPCLFSDTTPYVCNPSCVPDSY